MRPLVALILQSLSTAASPTFHLPNLISHDASPHQAVLGQKGEQRPRFPHKPGHQPSGFVALGDSYSAGIGTGLDGPEDACRHGVHAYPALIRRDLIDRVGHNHSSFQFLSCTGSTTNNLLAGSDPSQIDELNTTLHSDFALLSVGGNDLGFFDIMNSCIFRFYSVYSGTCEAALQKSHEQLASPDFEHRLRLVITEILDRVKWEKRPWFTIFVTGYARFFSTETDDCDESSFGVWWRGPKLRRELRQEMNEMVRQVNNKIKRSIDSINSEFAEPKIYFVDYDAEFEGHRFCEPGVVEPAYDRNETWFFLVGGPDNSGDLSSNFTESSLPPSLSSLVDSETCLPAAQRSGDWGELALCMMAKAVSEDPELRTAGGQFVAQDSMWHVPTYYAKTFHPVCIQPSRNNLRRIADVGSQRTLGHQAIRDQVYKVWEDLYLNTKGAKLDFVPSV